MPKTYYDSELTGEQIESALEAIDGVVTPSNNGKILRVKDGNIEAVSASEYTSGIDVEPLSVTSNDTYTAPAGKAYSPVTVNVSGGGSGGDLPSGGSDGDVLIKSGTGAAWTPTPPQMGSLAYINTESTADKLYNPGEYLVYNGQLYKVGSTAIGPGETLTPGGNIKASSIGEDMFNDDYSGEIEWNSAISWSNYHTTTVSKSGRTVAISVRAYQNEGFQKNTTILTLPADLRPKITIESIFDMYDYKQPSSATSKREYGLGSFRINPNGELYYADGSGYVKSVYASFIYFI